MGLSGVIPAPTQSLRPPWKGILTAGSALDVALNGLAEAAGPATAANLAVGVDADA